ncbi:MULTISPECIES: adenylyltransferase/cytidyltransferase family protein [Candidatus Nitrosocaldus]|jgi:cytidyltransferase-like protein|nr:MULTISPECIES: adenylyltransferase/cytidyltransferase family protein [Candidatus Nitrosocaldus]GBC74408.1 Glycerol-3-phosphate cytidylyltransferase [archaeon HR05]
MDAIDKGILASLYIEDVVKRAGIGTPINEILDHHNLYVVAEHRRRLESLGMIKDGMLTELGRSAIRVVLTGGVFDIIHPGHIHTLRAAKSLGDVLVVVIARDSTVARLKGKKPLHDEGKRRELVASIRFVDLAMIGHESDIFKTVELIKPDIIALGYDQVHEEQFISKECQRRGLKAHIVRLTSPIPDLKSSMIKAELGSSIYTI